MGNDWTRVPLGELLERSEEWIDIRPDQRYRQVTVRLWGEGVVERSEVSGADIAASRRLVVQNGQFIFSRIDARNGAFGIVPEFLDGAVVSNDFPVFSVRQERLIPSYLGWLSRTPGFVDRCRTASEGTTNRVRLKEDRFLSLTIPLPLLAEQRRIVSRIEELVAKIELARELRKQAMVQTGDVVPALLHATMENLKDKQGTLGQGIISARNGLSRRPSGVESGPVVLRLADLSTGKIDLSNPRRGALSESELEAYSLTAGDLLFVRVNGSRDIVGRCIPFHGAPERICFNDHLIRVRLDMGVFEPEFVAVMTRSPTVREFIGETAITTAGQFTINQRMLADMPMPIPSLGEQQRIGPRVTDLEASVDTLRLRQSETASALDALVPSVLDRAFEREL